MEIREILSRHGFAFKKKFGQNFLTDPNLLDAIVSDAGVDEHTTVLEIGADAGALTRALAKRAKRVVAFEIDESLRPVLHETLSEFQNVELLFSDFEKCDFPALEKKLGPYVVVANLPYYITTPVVMKFVEESTQCRGITVMVQEEVALRFAAQAGTPDYGAVTAAIALRGRCELVRKVPRTLFYPRPNVDSAVVRVTFGEGNVAVSDARAYRAAVRAAFSSRRKTLENNLIAAFRISREEAKAILADANVPEGVRGETLSPADFARLVEAISAHSL